MRMHTTEELLDAAKAAQGITSDYKLAMLLRATSTSVVSNYRHGRSHPDDKMAQRIAEAANMDAGYVAACIHAQRATDDEVRRMWEGVAAKLAAPVAVAAPARKTRSVAKAPKVEPLHIMSTGSKRRLLRAMAKGAALSSVISPDFQASRLVS